MKIHMTKLAFRGLAAALALTAPGLGWAADHILSLTGISTSVCPTPGVTQSQAAVVNSSGTVTTALILSGLQANGAGCGAGNINDNVNFTGTLTPETRNTKLCKPGTKGKLEWLDEGSTIVGAHGTLTASVNPVTYQLNIPAGIISVQDVSGPCSQLGQSNYTVTRAATTILKDRATLATASVVTGSAGGIPTIPEPGTLSLIALGLASLGWMGSRRTRKARASAV